MTPDPPTIGPAVAAGEFADADDLSPDVGARMTFLEHLDELRRRIIYSIYALVATCAVTFYFMDRLSLYMQAYFTANGGKLIFTQITEGFMFEFKVAGLAGLVLASPFIFSQFWLFVAPGLYAREKKVVLPFVASATVLFGGGVWFAHVYAFPAMFKFFAGFTTAYLQGLFTIGQVFSFYVKMILGLGLIFELPMLVFFLARFGIVTAKFLIKKTKYAILIIFIIAAIVTPSPDPVNQCIFAAPMLVLYALSILIAWLFGKKPAKA
jgi:sec-independent protein translocase protein TatC